MNTQTLDYSRDTNLGTALADSQLIKKQNRMDSFMEASCNTAVGFVISFFTWMWVVAPLFHYSQSAGQSFLITTIFTFMSVVRGYVLRRLFDGKTIWETLRGRFTT